MNEWRGTCATPGCDVVLILRSTIVAGRQRQDWALEFSTPCVGCGRDLLVTSAGEIPRPAPPTTAKASATQMEHLPAQNEQWRAGIMAEAAEPLADALARYAQHKGDCSRWGPSYEYPRHLHNEIVCTCGLASFLASRGA